MIPALQNVHPILFNLVNESVLVGYPPAPTTGKIAFKRFRLTNSFVRRSQTIFYKVIYPD
ncbi:MAG TPA: hypothetical protein VJ844_02875 [Mucilaginibacter sp.]|nr:hypothetical protein [Mucilaginibacter sp.]